MHELSVCQGLMRQVERIAAENGAQIVSKIVLKVGPLSGIEPDLLQHAFTIAREGTVASGAELEVQGGQLVVHCRECGGSGEAAPNRLLCPDCGGWQVDVTEGEELLLMSMDLEE
ncbi:MAG: hydrogenase maturation nickel metallochaperone HypA [Xanthomonadales bacterium]|nr:hydrogenase maturation nickel metallochaperone HypA [Xanthomonadales bacterium]